MARVQLDMHSDALGHATTVEVILPQAARTQIGMDSTRRETFPTLYLLHGLSDDQTIWGRRTSIERYASRYGIAVVMPNGGRSWYTDMAHGERYFTYIAEELPALCRSFFCGMSDRPEANYIAGLSMGGYGAWKIALRQPGRWGGVASFSGAMDVAHRTDRFGTPYWEDVFGPSERLEGSEEDVYALARRAVAEHALPEKMYLACGTEDFFFPDTQKMQQILASSGRPFVYRAVPGDHTWELWDAEVEQALAYFFGA